MNPDQLARVVCRPALLRDTADMLALTSHIWEGHDYLPHVWADWLADEDGFLAVAEYCGHVVGIAKLEYQQPGEWYLAGLRVHPKMEGRGIARQLHDYLLDTWHRRGESGVIRLATYRPKVKHLCERTGFREICQYTPFIAPNLSEPVNTFTPLLQDKVDLAMDVITSSLVFEWVARMYDRGWSWSALQDKFILQACEQGRAWSWRGGLGVLLVEEDSDYDGIRLPLIRLIGCSPEALLDMLLDFRRWAAAQGYMKVGWVASLHPDLQPYLQAAGFVRDWDEALSLFER